MRAVVPVAQATQTARRRILRGPGGQDCNTEQEATMAERPKDGEHRAGVPEPVSTPPIVAGDADEDGLEGIDADELWAEVDGDDGG
jgi:hypothetical protein